MNFQIRNKIDETIKIIFKDKNIANLNNYQKRKLIFAYLCDNLKYDFVLLDNIKSNVLYKTKIVRDMRGELNSAIFDGKGICNSISQYYKLLLEAVNIKAYCVICDDGTPVAHQLSLVYDDDSKTFSLDDVTSVVVKRGTKSDFFDYDIQSAKAKNQGNKKLVENDKFVILPEEYVDFLVDRDCSPYQSIAHLPKNIGVVKNIKKELFLEKS